MQINLSAIYGEKHQYSIPSGPALVYLYRRFGYTDSGSDPDKHVCDYSIPTAVDGLYVDFCIGGTGCFVYPGMSRNVRRRYSMEERLPFTEWWQRLDVWALTQGRRRLVASYEDFDLFLSQVGTWLEARGIDPQTVDDAVWQAGLDKEYFAYSEQQNAALRNEYEQIEPYPDNPPKTDFIVACQTAVADTLRDMLRPVRVRDVYINILGAVPDEELGEWDDAQERLVNEVARCPYAGNGVPAGAYDNPHLFIDFMYEIKELGQGDMVAGITAVRDMLAAKTKKDSE